MRSRRSPKCLERAPAQLIDEMMKLHGERGNPYTLWTAADGVKDQLLK
jgi:hypothetical protein